MSKGSREITRNVLWHYGEDVVFIYLLIQRLKESLVKLGKFWRDVETFCRTIIEIHTVGLILFLCSTTMSYVR